MRRAILAVGLCGVLWACEEEGVRTYRAPKQQASAAAKVVWTLPAGWQEVKSDQSMRVATFKAGEGLPEVVVSAFAGESGGLLANINRWRGQMGLAQIGEGELANSSESVVVEGVRVTLVDLRGEGGKEMLGAVVVPGDGQTWFVKATGEAAGVARIKPAFEQFAKSFRLGGAGASAATGAPAAPPPKPVDVDAELKGFKPPATWKVDEKPPMFVAAAFDATNAEGGARVTVTMLKGDGGGPLANINRWREQMGLGPVQTVDQQSLIELGGGNVQVDLTSADGAKRMVVAVVSGAGETWFFKVTGTVKGVEAERAAFDSMVRTVGLGAK